VPAEHRDDLVIYDFAPTVLSLAGLPKIDRMRGRAITDQTLDGVRS
jgi:arylsulfatase A-like enzyme